jgi:4-amino-4-deoxy-L-arabinose transferase-like glycosyltransferase
MNEIQPERLRRGDAALLTLFCVLLFGYSLVGGRPLSMHEAVLPQTSREMYADHDWVIPKNGGRPWLENPPLPQWITVGVASLIGRCDEVWIVRIPPAIMGTLSVLLVAWMASVWFGRVQGMLSGLILATMHEFSQYSWLAEDEIFLCTLVTAAVAAFVRLEFVRPGGTTSEPTHFFARRSGSMLLLFVALGCTNLAKGLIFGTAMAVIPIAGYLLWNRDLKRILPYFWCWGWLAYVAIAVAWPVAAWMRYPDVTDLWAFDHVGRLNGKYEDITQPVWYYAKVLPGLIAPWTPLALAGLWLTRRTAFSEAQSPERFLWCWAILPPLVFSIPHGKHHHYLLHVLSPWAVLAVPGLIRLREWILSWPERTRRPINSVVTLAIPGAIAIWVFAQSLPGPVWLRPALVVTWAIGSVMFSWGVGHRNGRIAAATLFSGLFVAFCTGHSFAGAFFDQCRFDAAFFRQVRDAVPADAQLCVNGDFPARMEDFRILFSMNERTKSLFNLTFLADERLRRDEIYLITRHADRPTLANYGKADVILQSERTRREKSPDDRLTLFRLKFRDDLVRLPADHVRVSPMQAMAREVGPYLR